MKDFKETQTEVIDIKQKIGETWITHGGEKINITNIIPNAIFPIMGISEKRHLCLYSADGRRNLTMPNNKLDLYKKL